MTASTEKERASLSAFIEMAEREGFDTAHQWYEAKGWVFFSPSTADCWRYWQAARRAPAVPQGWKITEEMHVAAVKVLHRASGVDGLPQRMVDAMLAAAPQPPEADIDTQELEHTRREAESLAWNIFNRHFSSDEHYASGRVKFGLCDTLRGVLSQIDNMVAGLVRAPEAAAVQLPVELLERIQESLGSFVSDQGWSQSDMDTADALDGLLAAHGIKEQST
ncbi:hypothetical protein KXJ72_11515 [Comamonas aquatica]|nr:hypothetical protein KXJ72_11515 [Comamonas aquatica]